MSGTAADISLVHWRQQWLENGTLYFHVSMSSSGQLARATAPTLQEPSEIVEEQMHILHISVMSAGVFGESTTEQIFAFGLCFPVSTNSAH
ncbi:PREDICTED: astrotactin-2-like [Miniopterus natalensis]|uniref:astrotactin-2-like n=1 Tax=Miniopterus natalensis TaxID=291302 RepID=UPI0007A6ED3F|nr:PREDICTED: astrotactin-2-like [Miniopterus natalensis]